MENENEMYNVIVSDIAAEMLLVHVRFLANVSEEAARKLIEEFKISAKSLETFPDRNPRIADLALPINKYRSLLLMKRYLVIYQIKIKRVYIDYIVDCRQNYRWFL